MNIIGRTHQPAVRCTNAGSDTQSVAILRTYDMKITNTTASSSSDAINDIDPIVKEFRAACEPVERGELHIFVDNRTGARYCECHIHADKICQLATINVALDPDDQLEYRANREIVTNHHAFATMKEDAKAKRSFSNIVIEYLTDYDEEHPLKVIGGQHRVQAITEAYLALDSGPSTASAISEDQKGTGINEVHGVKIYFGLNQEQRLDAQLISNTVIAVSTDLYDRMQETVKGPQLRDWCQKAGLLMQEEDFADKRQRGFAITVRDARTFILNYYKGKTVGLDKFEHTDTTPIVCKSGQEDIEWEKLRKHRTDMWRDEKLLKAGQEYAELVSAQRARFTDKKEKPGKNVDFAEKALNSAILSAWAFVAGMCHGNPTRLQKLYDLRKLVNTDPLNASALVRGRHKTDAESYRGLGYRTDAKERGRFVELFFILAEKGGGINTNIIDLAIKKYHAKQSVLEVVKAEATL